jgi:hypothetical protein
VTVPFLLLHCQRCKFLEGKLERNEKITFDLSNKIVDTSSRIEHLNILKKIESFIRFLDFNKSNFHSLHSLDSIKWVPCHHGMVHHHDMVEGEGLQVWRVAATILNKQLQTTLSSCLLSRNVQVKIYKTINSPSFCMGVKLGLSH